MVATKQKPTTAAKPRGFATLTIERRREIASMGGRSVPAHKRAYAQDRTLASTAGRKGGMAKPIKDDAPIAVNETGL